MRQIVHVGNLRMGDGNVSVQSMTTVKTSDVEKCVAQILALEGAGCDVARVAVSDEADALALRAVRARVHVPVVADVHFSAKLAVLAVENGASKLRINPGNIGGEREIALVADCVKAHGVPVRVGANTGSIEKHFLERFGRSAEALVGSALYNAEILEKLRPYHEIVQDILDYPLPTYSLKNNADLADRVKALHDRGIASVGNMQCTIWETSWYLRGMENLMMDMLTDEDMAAAILDRVAAMSTQRALLYANAGCDILFLGDDIGMQHSIMMSRELYTTWIQPRLKKLIAAVKAVRPDIIVFYHSCGFIEPLIDDLIDAGIDVLNPIQSECMDFGEIYAKYHDRLVFHGTIGTQKLVNRKTGAESGNNTITAAQ